MAVNRKGAEEKEGARQICRGRDFPVVPENLWASGFKKWNRRELNPFPGRNPFPQTSAFFNFRAFSLGPRNSFYRIGYLLKISRYNPSNFWRRMDGIKPFHIQKGEVVVAGANLVFAHQRRANTRFAPTENMRLRADWDKLFIRGVAGTDGEERKRNGDAAGSGISVKNLNLSLGAYNRLHRGPASAAYKGSRQRKGSAAPEGSIFQLTGRVPGGAAPP